MRYHLLGLILLAGASAPALVQAQPYGQPLAQPYVQSEAQTGAYGGVPATSALANLVARIDAMERQLATLTGQNEESAHRIRQLERQLAEARGQGSAAPVVAKAETAQPQPQSQPALGAPIEKRLVQADVKLESTGDAGEDAYLIGFRQWEEKHYGEAQKSLEAMAKKYPKHARASYAMNLAGRAYLDDGKPATAAKILLANYQANPKGERAADSLYFLGQALMQLKKGPEACKVYDELAEVYPNMRAWVKERLPQARAEAKCAE